jgi:flagellin
MGFQINTNIGALKAYNALSSLNSQTEKAQLRLASQKRINSVADDTSGFNVGKALDQKVKLMQAAQGNVGSAKDMLATAESQLISIKDDYSN